MAVLLFPVVGAVVDGDAMASWREQEWKTQACSREENESAARARETASRGNWMCWFRCECGDRRCTWAIQLTRTEYESVRAYATHFAIAPNHENPENEHLVEEHERFAVVATVSRDAVKVARKSDPRRMPSGGVI